MVDMVEIFRVDKGIVVLQFLKIVHQSVIPGRIYDFPNLKKWMCELCTFSQIRSQLMNDKYLILSKYKLVNNSHNMAPSLNIVNKVNYTNVNCKV